MLEKGGTSPGTILALTASFPVQFACLATDFSVGHIAKHGATLVPSRTQVIPRPTRRPGSLVVVHRHAGRLRMLPSQAERTSRGAARMVSHHHVVAAGANVSKGHRLLVAGEGDAGGAEEVGGAEAADKCLSYWLFFWKGAKAKGEVLTGTAAVDGALVVG